MEDKMSAAKKVDKVLGELEYDIVWFRKENMTFLGEDYPVVMFINCYSGEDIIQEQRCAYLNFKKNSKYLTAEFEKEIFTYYQSICEEYRDRLGDLADQDAPIIHSVEELKGLVIPNSFSIEYTPGKRTINFCFSTKWDPEFDIGIQCVNEKITIVGTHADIL